MRRQLGEEGDVTGPLARVEPGHGVEGRFQLGAVVDGEQPARLEAQQDVQTTLDTYAWVTDDEELRSLADWETATRRWKEDHGQEA